MPGLFLLSFLHNLFVMFFSGFPGEFERLLEDFYDFFTFNNDSEFFFPVGDHYFVVEEIDFRCEIHNIFWQKSAATQFLFI